MAGRALQWKHVRHNWEIYEAADVDGVSWWSKFTSLEFPMLAGSLRIVVIMAIIETIKDAGMIQDHGRLHDRLAAGDLHLPALDEAVYQGADRRRRQGLTVAGWMPAAGRVSAALVAWVATV